MEIRRVIARSFEVGSGERCIFKNGLIIIILALFSFYLTSCSNGPKNEDKGKTAKEIMHDYSQNLSSAPDRAKKAAALEEKRNSSQEEAMRELDK